MMDTGLSSAAEYHHPVQGVWAAVVSFIVVLIAWTSAKRGTGISKLAQVAIVVAPWRLSRTRFSVRCVQ
jgi:hypothetical protein